MRRAPLLLAALALTTLAAPAAAQGPVGDQFRISQTGTDGDLTRDAIQPDIALNAQNGEFLPVWVADGLATDNEDEIFGQRLGPLGAEILGDFRISNAPPEGGTDRPLALPAIAHNSNANEYLVVWQQDQFAGAQESNEIFGQRIAADGTELGDDFRITTTGPNDTDVNREAEDPAVAYNPIANEYLVVFHARGNVGGTTKQEIGGQRISAAGELLGDDFRVSNTRTDVGADQVRGARWPEIEHSVASNEYLVTFMADGSATDDDDDVWGQRLNATGGEIGGDFQISSTEGDDREAGIAPGGLAYNSRQNEWFVVFLADRTVNDELEVYAHRLAADGTNLAGPIRISTIGPEGDATRAAFEPAAAYSSIGNEYLVAFQGDDFADGDAEVFAQRVAADGTELGGDTRLSSFGGDGAVMAPAGSPDLTYSPFTNEFMVVLRGDPVQGGEDEVEIYGRRFASGDTLDPILVATASKTATARKRRVRIKLACNEPCALTTKATVTGLSKSFRLKTVKKTLAAAGQTTITLAIPKSKLAAILARIRAGRKVLVKASVRAVDNFGNDATAKKNVRLK